MKINKYKYACENCSYEYMEQRKESEPQYVLSCPSCFGKFELLDTEFIENEAELIIIKESIDETLAE